MVLRAGASRRSVGHEDWDFMEGISAVVEETPCPSCQARTQSEVSGLRPKQGPLPGPEHTRALILDFHLPKGEKGVSAPSKSSSPWCFVLEA